MTSMWVIHRDWTASQKLVAPFQGTFAVFSAIWRSSSFRTGSSTLSAHCLQYMENFSASSFGMVQQVIMARSCAPCWPFFSASERPLYIAS